MSIRTFCISSRPAGVGVITAVAGIIPESFPKFQVNLENTYLVTAVETQGRYGNGTGREFVSEYMIDYLRPGSKWIRYRNRTGHTLMTGNDETTQAVLRVLDPPLVASRLRIVPHSRQTRTICLRAELHGCLHKDGLLYYSTLPGGSRVGDADFRDTTFENSDLYTETGIKRGLGLLSDGYVADSSPFDEMNPNGSWIGWSKHHTDGTVTLLFEFDQLRNFSEILLAAYGHRLNSIDVIFSQDGTNFSLSSQISSLNRPSQNTSAKRYDLRIPLHKRMAKKIRVTITFTADWLFLTEIHFSSGILHEVPIGYNLFYNESSTNVVMEENTVLTRRSIFGVIGTIFLFFAEIQQKALVALFILLTAILCVIILMRRKKSEDKMEIFERDIRRNLIITQVGGKTATEVLPSPSAHLMTNFYASDKTTSTSYVAVHHYATIPVREQTEKVRRISSSQLIMGAELGEGKHTIVRECAADGLGTVAYKTIKDRHNLHARSALMDEIKMLLLTNHPHVIRLLATDENNGLILEMAANGNVREYLRSQRLPMPEILLFRTAKLLAICADVCEGMQYLESLGVIHGHLTPSNILLDEGLRAKISSPRGPAHHAQLRYSAPESILKNSFSSNSDVWAFAVCCWEIAETSCTRIPFETFSNADLVTNAQRMLTGHDNAVVPSFTESIPRGIRDVFVRCFEIEPQARPLFAHISYFMSKYHASLD
ncbi:f5/8 type C domain protein [Ancylostoma caninum]|uniref:F5/8 type C domain protein n=1 Tax=Ancylostoma caninum TaxID=29170 RepID=A0A368FS59_ANCCA|nr:f5/8 type C domain protein [Ancylostoma caninum]